MKNRTQFSGRLIILLEVKNMDFSTTFVRYNTPFDFTKMSPGDLYLGCGPNGPMTESFGPGCYGRQVNTFLPRTGLEYRL